ncbi:hypothetical protein KAX02_02995 [candidate division WOR-3 bacterium]|nr:hypothetical protein [candidate division WOR-3 bacterium]
MGLQIVHPESNQRSWVPVEPGETCYLGQLVGVDIATPLEGVRPLPVAAGANNTTNKDIPMGIVVGTNNTASNLVTDSTYGEKIVQVAAGSIYGSTTQFQGVEGPWAKGDPQAYVLIDHIDATTILRAPIRNGAIGTAPSVETTTTGCGGDGINCVTGTCDVATVANFATIYMRTGANMGIYRTMTSASDTTHTWLKAMPNTIAVGDTCVVINGVRPYGPARAYIDAEGVYIDASAALSSNYFIIHVRRLDLSVAGDEYVEFRFDGDNFCATRA